VRRYRDLSETSPDERIARLLAREMGRVDGPVPE
jgi:hypothetical protein